MIGRESQFFTVVFLMSESTMHFLSRCSNALALAALFLAGIGSAVAASVLTVGAGCQYSDLQTAINNVGTAGTFELHVLAG